MNGSVPIPGSKSLSHRAMIAAALADGESLLKGVLFCGDTDYTRKALEMLGAVMAPRGEDLLVQGTGGRLKRAASGINVFMGNAGTTLRFLLSVVSLSRGEFVLDGSPRMRQRPVGILAHALNALGARVRFPGKTGFPPVLVEARGLSGGSVEIPGEESSQHLSSLFLAAPYAREDTEVRVTGQLLSRPYVDMTVKVMEAFGAGVSRQGYELFRVKSGEHYQPRTFTIEADVSAAGYFWAGAAVSGGSVTTVNVDPFATSQGDIGFLDILEEMGCRVKREPGKVTVQGGTLNGVEVDMGTMPDTVPTLAAVALFATGKTVIRNVAHIRLKESDRIGAVAAEWKRLGARVEELPDGLVVEGGLPLKGASVDPHHDHRIAMSLAVIGLRVPGLVITDKTCVNKSFPTFWDLWDALR